MDVERLIAKTNKVDDTPRLLDPPKDVGLTANNIKAQRALPILDALANVLVGPASGEILAVGIQADEQNVILTLASNNAVSDEVVHHADIIWHHLQKLAKGYHDYQAGSDEELPIETESNIYDFEFVVYGFSLPRIQRRLTKMYGAMDSRFYAFGRFIEFPPVKVTTELMKELKSIYEMVEYIYEALIPSGQALSANNAQFQDFRITFDTLVEAIEDLLKNTDLSTELQRLDTNYLDFPLIRYLKKIISLPCSVEKLERFAAAPKLRRLFLQNKTFEIQRVANIHRPIILQSSDEWETISSAALRSCNVLLPSAQRPGTDNHSHDRNEIPAPIHSECAVVLHFLQPTLRGPLPLPYIGVSKLSCFACWEFLAFLRE